MTVRSRDECRRGDSDITGLGLPREVARQMGIADNLERVRRTGRSDPDIPVSTEAAMSVSGFSNLLRIVR